MPAIVVWMVTASTTHSVTVRASRQIWTERALTAFGLITAESTAPAAHTNSYKLIGSNTHTSNHILLCHQPHNVYLKISCFMQLSIYIYMYIGIFKGFYLIRFVIFV